jgi:hypothetical protein
MIALLGLKDAADRNAIGKDVIVLVAPLAGWARSGGALEKQIVLSILTAHSDHSRLANRQRNF